ncbi:hypothetical protein CGCSCA4_v010712 [Colletotrichum siamense]|nr:hypothetical protein CGCSCA4_v010712 [Colletotrichum siamense]
MDAAPFYKKLGFAKVGGFRISIPAKNGGEETLAIGSGTVGDRSRPSLWSEVLRDRHLG